MKSFRVQGNPQTPDESHQDQCSLIFSLHLLCFYEMRHPVCACRGGWQADGKGASIWDTFCHERGGVFGEQSADVSCNSYELWDRDLQCIQQLGLTHYRLSLSWARLLPDGTTQRVNQKGGTARWNMLLGWCSFTLQ